MVSCSREAGVGNIPRLLILLILVTMMSMGILVSYRLGATRMIPQVPATQAKLNSHNKILSSTVATYFQSSETSARSKWDRYAGIFLFIQEAIILLVSTKYYKSSSDVETVEALHQPQEVI